MKKIVLSVLILSLFSLLFPAQEGEPLRSRISRDSILIGDQIEWTFDFSIAPGEEAPAFVKDSELYKANKAFENDYFNKFQEQYDYMLGQNLMPCHSEKSQEKIRHMIATDTVNCYTIDKQGVKKMIYQTPWRRDGKVCGMVEISMVIPQEMPHYVRSEELGVRNGNDYETSIDYIDNGHPCRLFDGTRAFCLL